MSVGIMIIVIAVCLVIILIFAIKEKKEAADEKNQKKYRIICNDAIIEYDVEPPNFRSVHGSTLSACGDCIYTFETAGRQPICKKYGVRYYGFGCLCETICDDFQSIIPESPISD